MNLKDFFVKHYLLIFGILLMVGVFSLATLYIYYTKENTKCYQSPLVYGAKQFSDQGVDITCSCTPENRYYKGFWFNGSEISFEPRFDLVSPSP
jgi:hypothetical protein